MEVKEFLDNFVSKEIIRMDGRKKVSIKVFQCPKCEVEGRSGGTFTTPINFIGHIIQDCPDAARYTKDVKILNFLKEQDLSSLMKDLMNQLQGLFTPEGVKE